MVYVTLALALAVPIGVMAWLYLRLELQLWTEDKIGVHGLKLVGDAAFAAFIDLADDRPFGIKAPRLGPFQSRLASLYSRCSASAFFAARTAAEGRLCLPFSRGADSLRRFEST